MKTSSKTLALWFAAPGLAGIGFCILFILGACAGVKLSPHVMRGLLELFWCFWIPGPVTALTSLFLLRKHRGGFPVEFCFGMNFAWLIISGLMWVVLLLVITGNFGPVPG